MKTFEELEAWKLAKELRMAVSNLSKELPNDEKYRLADQMIRASRSVTANIAEGYGRFHHQENIQFCRQSRGSIMELVDHLSVALEEKYITEKQFTELRDNAMHCNKVLNGYIAYLKRAKEDSKI